VPGKPSTIGFGFQPFGQYPWGSSDWAEEVLWRILPIWMRDSDAQAPGLVDMPLRSWIDTIKPYFEEIRFKWSIFPDLMDAQFCPLSNLPQLAYTFGLPEQDEEKSEALRRSEILNATTLYRNKGTDLGYEIMAGFEGLVVEITPIWAETKLPGAALIEGDDYPSGTEFVADFDDFPADALPADATFDDPFARWPAFLDIDGICRTHRLRLFFTTVDDTEIKDFTGTSQRVLQAIERVRPIHVIIDAATFDGTRGVGGGWSISVQAENSAVGGGWSIPVASQPSAVAGGWSIPVVATPVP